MTLTAMATLADALTSFTAATSSAIEGLPANESLLPPENGITLLDAKNELFLSYLQSLALRNLNVIRSLKDGASSEDVQVLSDELTKKLVEHRVYLERGVRPLEQRIKYQVDKVVKAADDEERSVAQKAKSAASSNGHRNVKEEASDASDADEDASEASAGAEIDDLAFRPNPAAFGLDRPTKADDTRRTKSKADGVYRPPRISATSMPTTETRERRDRGPGRSSVMDEYVSNEMSTAPLAEPSIGSTITAGGRRTKNAKDLVKEQERREYEETNLVRLPQESKKDRQAREGRSKGTFGGEEWRGIGDSVSRIGDLTRKKGKDSLLDKSRKRRAVQDGPRDSGIGGAFEIKKRRMDKKTRR